jgi:hypothetical protein
VLLKDVISKDNATLFAYGDKCLELLYIHTTWVNAELECKQKGGHLIEIDNSIEQRVVHQVIDTYYHESVWIGLHDRRHEERFEWTSGKFNIITMYIKHFKVINYKTVLLPTSIVSIYSVRSILLKYVCFFVISI